MLTEEQQQRLGIALNEAILIDVNLDPDAATAVVTFAPLSLPEEGAPPETVQFHLGSVGRAVASLREGRWDDPKAKVVPFAADALRSVVAGFQNLPIYGWEFLGTAEAQLAKLSDRISLDWTTTAGGMRYSLNLFQEGPRRHLDLLLWFDSLAICDHEGRAIPVDTFIADGERWWDALHSGDPRAGGHGIYPLK